MESNITGRIKHLDGLRGWGSVIVLLHHLLLFLPQMGGWYGRFMTDGPFAVFVFFVVSGFAVSAGHLLVNRERLAASMVGRYFRLGIPVAVVSVMAYVLMLTGSMHNVACHAGGLLDELYQFEPSLPGVLKFVSFDVFFGYRPEASYDCV